MTATSTTSLDLPVLLRTGRLHHFTLMRRGYEHLIVAEPADIAHIAGTMARRYYASVYSEEAAGKPTIIEAAGSLAYAYDHYGLNFEAVERLANLPVATLTSAISSELRLSAGRAHLGHLGQLAGSGIDVHILQLAVLWAEARSIDPSTLIFADDYARDQLSIWTGRKLAVLDCLPLARGNPNTSDRCRIFRRIIEDLRGAIFSIRRATSRKHSAASEVVEAASGTPEFATAAVLSEAPSVARVAPPRGWPVDYPPRPRSSTKSARRPTASGRRPRLMTWPKLPVSIKWVLPNSVR